MADTNQWSGWDKVQAPTSVGFQWTKPGETVKGVLKEVTVDSTYNNKRYVLDTEKGEISFFGTSVLNNRLKNAVIGDNIGIEYKGEVKSKQGRLFKDFDIFIKKVGHEEVVR